MTSLKGMSNAELINQLKKLVAHEQHLTLTILPHLVEVERRTIYLEKAYSTLTEYCIHELGYGESSAWRRVRAARVIKDVPEVYDLMSCQKLSLSTVLQIAKVIDAHNKDSLLPRIVGKSKSEVDAILAEYQIPQAIPDTARLRMVKKPVPAPSAPAGASSTRAGERASGPELGQISLHGEGKFDPTVNISTPEINVVVEKMFEIRFAADEELMELIRWLKCHLSHTHPKGASFLEIFKYALTYVKQREDFALQEAPRKSSAKTDTRHIPKAIKQKVWKRDQGRCTHVGTNGKRCNSDYLVQFDHYPVPFARGSPSTVNNLRLLCAKHNRHSAEKTYGKAHVKKYYAKEARADYRWQRIPRSRVHTIMLC
jgi:5-methylcytosine-specific restriction endonuclease McrA